MTAVHLNLSVNTALNKKNVSSRRPDVSATRKNKKIDFHEVPSKKSGQTPEGELGKLGNIRGQPGVPGGRDTASDAIGGGFGGKK